MWRRVSRRRSSTTSYSSLREGLRSAFTTLYKDRRCLATIEGSEPIRWMKYEDVWSEATSLGHHLLSVGADGACVGIYGSNSEHWIITDLACIIAGLVSVPVPVTLRKQDLNEFIDRFCIKKMVVCNSISTSDIPEKVSVVNYSKKGEFDHEDCKPATLQRYFTILTTSGTSGPPKGVPYTCESWLRSTSKIYVDRNKYPDDDDGCNQEPAFLARVCYQPLHHITERHQLFTTFFNGGETCIIKGGFTGDGFFAAVKLVSPTVFSGTVGFFRLAIEFANRTGDEQIFGNRLHTVMCGAGTLSEGDERSLSKATGTEVIVTGYGSTEFGNIAYRFWKAADGQKQPCPEGDPFPLTVASDVELKLADIDQQVNNPDSLFEVGEATVRRQLSSEAMGEFGGYLRTSKDVMKVVFSSQPTANNNEPSLKVFTSWYQTGDIIKRLRGTNRIAVVGRVGSSVKLLNGTFFVPERTERALQSSPLIIRAIVVISSGVPYALLQVPKEVISSSKQHLREILQREIGWVQSTHNLQPLERVTRILEIFSDVPSGLLGPTGGPRRKNVQQYVDNMVEVRSSPRSCRRKLSLEGDVAALVTHFESILRFSSGEVHRCPVLCSCSFPELGGDSLLAMKFVQTLDAAMKEKLTRSRSLFEDLMKHGVTLEDLIDRLNTSGVDTNFRNQRDVDSVHTSPCPAGRKSRIEKFKSAKNELLEVFLNKNKQSRRPEQRNSAVVLTGATGFIGVHVLREILTNTSSDVHVFCVGIRASDDSEARLKLENQLHKAAIDISDKEGRLHACCGDIKEPFFGLSEDGISTLFSFDIVSVTHCAAAVNFVSPVEELFDINVTSTIYTLAFSAVVAKETGCRVKFNFMSSTDAGKAERNAIVTGYATTKLMCDNLIQDTEHEEPITARSVRLPLIGPNTFTGCCQPDDWTVRCIQGVVWCRKVPDFDTHFPSFIPVDVVVTDLVREQPLSEPSPWNWETLHTALQAAGYPTDVVSVEEFTDAVSSDTRNPFHLLWKQPTTRNAIRSKATPSEQSLQSALRCVAYLRRLSFLPPSDTAF